MLEVLDVSGIASIQDRGRTGRRRFGVPASGPMDAFAFQAANLLAGNSPDAASVEIGGGDLELRAGQDCVIAVAGSGYALSVYTWEFPLWDSCFVRSGWTIRLSKSGPGMWAYLAVAGGIDVPSVLGSRSTYLRGQFGGNEGRLLQAGDILRAGTPAKSLSNLAARSLAEVARPDYSEYPTLSVILGPQVERFTNESLDTFLSSPYKVALASDRMGYRLEGPALVHLGSADLTSEGMTTGAVQVPASGQPIVIMSDSPTTGGYPKIACVTSADLPLLAQCAPGRGEVRFQQTTIEQAQERYRDLLSGLKNGIVDFE